MRSYAPSSLEPRRRARFLGTLLAGIASVVSHVHAASGVIPLRLDEKTQFPARGFRLVVPFPPGASTDSIARIIADRLEEPLGRRISVENRAGAGGNIGAEAVLRAAPDGHTWLLGTAGLLTINPLIYRTMSFDPALAFSPVTVVARVPYVLVVHPNVPVRTVGALIDFARRRPWVLNYGSAGNGSTIHLGAELFKAVTETKIVHIPYRGGAPAISDLMAGHLHMMFTSVPLAFPFVESGRLRALAVSSARRATMLPLVPTMEEAGVTDFEFTGWFALMVSSKTPVRVVSWLNQELVPLLFSHDVRHRLEAIGAEPATSTAAEVSVLMRRDAARWQRVVEGARVKLDWEDQPQ